MESACVCRWVLRKAQKGCCRDLTFPGRACSALDDGANTTLFLRLKKKIKKGGLPRAGRTPKAAVVRPLLPAAQGVWKQIRWDRPGASTLSFGPRWHSQLRLAHSVEQGGGAGGETRRGRYGARATKTSRSVPQVRQQRPALGQPSWSHTPSQPTRPCLLARTGG